MANKKARRRQAAWARSKDVHDARVTEEMGREMAGRMDLIINQEMARLLLGDFEAVEWKGYDMPPPQEIPKDWKMERDPIDWKVPLDRPCPRPTFPPRPGWPVPGTDAHELKELKKLNEDLSNANKQMLADFLELEEEMADLEQKYEEVVELNYRLKRRLLDAGAT